MTFSDSSELPPHPNATLRSALDLERALRNRISTRSETWMPKPYLDPKRRGTLEDLADIVIPRGGTLDPGAGDVDVASRINRYISIMPPRLRKRVLLLISVFDSSPLGAPGFFKPFHRLSSQRKKDWIEKVHTSSRARLKLPLFYLEQLIFMAYASAPEVEEAIGFDYTCRKDGSVHGRSGLQP